MTTARGIERGPGDVPARRERWSVSELAAMLEDWAIANGVVGVLLSSDARAARAQARSPPDAAPDVSP